MSGRYIAAGLYSEVVFNRGSTIVCYWNVVGGNKSRSCTTPSSRIESMLPAIDFRRLKSIKYNNYSAATRSCNYVISSFPLQLHVFLTHLQLTAKAARRR